jgi:hypothetical protein
MIDLEKLKASALAATPGPWESRHHEVVSLSEDVGLLNTICRVHSTTGYYESERDNRDFIATANPSMILELIERLEKAEKENSDYRMAHRSHFFLLSNARRICDAKTRRSANWVLARELFAVGSTSARKICIDAGIDPDALDIKRRTI